MSFAIDTSVWIEFFRGSSRKVVREVHRLIDEENLVLPVPVKIELLSGASANDRRKLNVLLSSLPQLFPTSGTWSRMEQWVDVAGKKGFRFGFADLLIAALAGEVGAIVWSVDRDFIFIEKLGFISTHTPE